MQMAASAITSSVSKIRPTRGNGAEAGEGPAAHPWGGLTQPQLGLCHPSLLLPLTRTSVTRGTAPWGTP